VSDVIVRQVSSSADLNAFIDLPWRLYANNPVWVPPLKADVRELLSPGKNPYFEHARAVYFLAEKNGMVVGRITAQVCDLVQVSMGAGIGQWGLFECVDDAAVANALFDAAETWLRAQGMTTMYGPFNLSVWDDLGLLIDGFGEAPRIMTGYALPYMQGLVENYGHTKIRDLYAYDLDIIKGFTENTYRLVAAAERNSKITLRKPDMKKLDAEISLFIDILNDSWADNWGYVPFTAAEKKYGAKKMAPIIRADMFRFCEYDGETAGFMWTVPDLNPTIKKCNGSLFPFGFLRILWALKRNHWPTVRVPLMGIRKKFQSGRQGGLMVMLMFDHIRRDVVANFGGERGELGWILEDNAPMNNILVSIGCTVYKTYRVYERPISFNAVKEI
jgi:hypothetical protein